MNRYRLCLILLATALAAQGCGSDNTNPTTPAEPANTKTIGFKFSTGKFQIEPGDTFECFYTDTITTKQLNVQSATAKQGLGGHHVTVYYTDQKVPVGHHHCTDVEMVGFHQVAGAADGKEGTVSLPDGYATKVPEGKQLVVQAHYIRTEDGPQTVEDEVELQTLETPDVTAFANSFVLNDGSFNLPPRSEPKSVTECVVPRDFDLLLLLGHMHESGAHYKLERINAAGTPTETLYETDWEPSFTSHPPVTSYNPSSPLKLAKGSRIRQTCNWRNTGDTEMAIPREMCVMFSYYVPDDGFIMCDTKEVK
jgi:hypothetical protein